MLKNNTFILTQKKRLNTSTSRTITSCSNDLKWCHKLLSDKAKCVQLCGRTKRANQNHSSKYFQKHMTTFLLYFQTILPIIV
jgi:16S rRNA G527 N7-methylase RsmG